MIAPITHERLKVNEIYLSVQGEGTRSGVPCVFVRLHGCGLRCNWCDTSYALDHSTGGVWMTFEEIRRELESYTARFVEFTGGEPLEQPNVHPLMEELANDGWTVAIETGGHMDISSCDPRIVRIVDFKPPGSGMMKRNLLANIDHLRPHDEVKFVCASDEDYEWARDLVRMHGIDTRVAAVLISPVHGTIAPHDLVSRILNDGLNARFQVQLHKIIWDPEARGV